MASELDLDKLSELEAKATPGPWEFGSRNGNTPGNPSEWGQSGMWHCTDLLFGEGPGYENTVQPNLDDAELIVALRNAAPALIAAAREAERLTVKVAELEAKVVELKGDIKDLCQSAEWS